MTNNISTEEQYDQALARIYDLMQLDLSGNSVEFVELENLCRLVKGYENAHHVVQSPNKG